MRTKKSAGVALYVPLLLTFTACAASGPSAGGSSAPPPEATMIAEFTDFPEPMPGDGSLNFTLSGDGSEFFEITAGGRAPGVAAGGNEFLSRERAADLVAGRLVETTGIGDGVFRTMTSERDGVRVVRSVTSIRLSLQGESAVSFTVQMGPGEGVGMPAPPDLPSTATLTVRGQLRLTCTIVEPGGSRALMDPAFSSPYCAGLRTELRLDALLAISNSI